jgi:hypothetical protein
LSWASLNPVQNELLGYGEEAWRSVGYVVPDEKGLAMWVPVEAFDEPNVKPVR